MKPVKYQGEWYVAEDNGNFHPDAQDAFPSRELALAEITRRKQEEATFRKLANEAGGCVEMARTEPDMNLSAQEITKIAEQAKEDVIKCALDFFDQPMYPMVREPLKKALENHLRFTITDPAVFKLTIENAARYLWLRNGSGKFEWQGKNEMIGEQIDAAIDAARKGERDL